MSLSRNRPVWDAASVARSIETPSERTERLVRLRIAQGKPGDQLPPIKEWAKELGTTRTTLGRVLSRLQAEGLVVTKVGWGTFIPEAPEDAQDNQD